MEAVAPTKVQKKPQFSVPEGCILEKMLNFASSVPEFRRTGKGNLRHKLGDIVMLLMLASLSKCGSRADILYFGKHYINKFQSMGLLKNGIPSEATLCRVDNGLDDIGFSDQMSKFAQEYEHKISKGSNLWDIICIDGKAMRGTTQENGRNPDIVSAYSFQTGVILATEACPEKSNEIKAVPKLLDKIDIAGRLVTADAMSMQKDIVDKIREKGGHFLIELKANQRALRYGVEDKVKACKPKHTYAEEPDLGHGRIETRTYEVYDGLERIADKEKWGDNLTVVKFISLTVNKSTGKEVREERLYVSSLPVDTPWIGKAIRNHWSIESMHWGLDVNLKQDRIKRKTPRAARNLDTMQRLVYSVFSIWKGLRKKKSDKAKGMAELMRGVSMSFTKLIRFLSQK